VSWSDVLVQVLQVLGLVIGVNLMVPAVTAGPRQACPREKLGYICRRGTSFKCDCEDTEQCAVCGRNHETGDCSW
jgi:hypothetical protein